MGFRIFGLPALVLLGLFLAAGALLGWSFGALVLGLITAAVLWVLSLPVLYLFLVRPFSRIAEVIAEMNKDNADLTRTVDTADPGPLDIFANYNGFLKRIGRTITELKGMVDRSTEIGESVEGAVKKAAVLNTDVAEAIGSNKEMISSLNSEIDSASEGIHAVREKIRELTGMITESQSASVNESTAAIEEMLASVENISRTAGEKKRTTTELGSVAETGSQDMAETLQTIDRVSEAADTAAEMVAVIDDVAEQINILAMNAAIEAAHAGEAGRGFAVVAAEVKKLAEKTNSNVGSISESLKAMKAQADSAAEMTRRTDETISRISGSIVEVTGGMTEIADGVSEISAGGEQIMKALQALLDITERVKSASAETDVHMDEVTGAVERVSSLSAGNLDNARRMEGLVEEISQSMETLRREGELNAEQLSGIDRELSRFATREGEAEFIIGFNEVPPFCMTGTEGTAAGAANDFLKAVLSEIGVTSFAYKHVQSLERMYEMLDRNSIQAYVLATATYDPNPSLRYRVPDKPTFTPTAGFLMREDHPVGRIGSAADLAGLTVGTKNGMPSTDTLASSEARMEYLGGEEPLTDCLRMVDKGRLDAVYSLIPAELEYMALNLGIEKRVKRVLLPDPPLEIYTAFSVPAAERYLDAYNRAVDTVGARKSFEEYLQGYLKG
jgi:methyl-accepting chemotaxis protein